MKDTSGIKATINTTTDGYGTGTGFVLSLQEIKKELIIV